MSARDMKGVARGALKRARRAFGDYAIAYEIRGLGTREEYVRLREVYWRADDYYCALKDYPVSRVV